MRRVFSKGAAVLVGLLALQASTSLSQEFDPPSYAEDPRVLILGRFFEGKESPVAYLARDFIVAADRNSLDWRLLPSIAVMESGAGKEYTNNNIFGWDSCKKRFPSVRAGIHEVAARLGTSKLYRHKGVQGILSTYNPNSDYAPRVMRIMKAIGPAKPILLQN